ncbi:MAG: alpha-amylase family protein [Treponemataceae bacterium]|nr:alpha-amylase family protein [Treponemataceae bacterium]
MEQQWLFLYTQCVRRLEERGLSKQGGWEEFSSRLHREFQRFAELLWRLYGHRPDFAYQVETIIANLFQAYQERADYLKERDRIYLPESGWFLSNRMVGAVAYVDRFAGTLKGVESRISYLKELGVTYLHLMPFFKSPEKENDGGYAISSYREVDPQLGTMEDLKHLARTLSEEGIALVADFVFNHTSDEHEWAQRAKKGERDYQDYYWIFSDYGETQRYQPYLRDIFPEVRRGSFTYCEALQKWVWTTFHSYQWDLNYTNPAVFNAMVQEMLFLANAGIAILRLDAVAFIWKKAGTSCENLEEAHLLIRAFQCAARIVCPSLLFKSEAIVHPKDIEKYIDLRECQLSYNPLLMAELWEAAATKEVRLLAYSLRHRHHLPSGCSWVNYVRCHDDIGWTFADEDAADVGIKGGDHRNFLNAFYMGEFPGTFSRGVSFQYNPITGDRRICGTAASLAGIEQALEEGSGAKLDQAIRRLVLLYGIVFSAGGIPLIYLGDEWATLNRYEYGENPTENRDSRWVHRPFWSQEAYERRYNSTTVEGRVFTAIQTMVRIRKKYSIFSVQSLTVADAGHPSVLIFHKQEQDKLLTVIGNFSESLVQLPEEKVRQILVGCNGTDLLTGTLVMSYEALDLRSCELLWILSPKPLL